MEISMADYEVVKILLGERVKQVEQLEKQNRDLRDALVRIEIIGRDTGSNSKACNMSDIARTALAECQTCQKGLGK